MFTLLNWLQIILDTIPLAVSLKNLCSMKSSGSDKKKRKKRTGSLYGTYLLKSAIPDSKGEAHSNFLIKYI